MIKQNNTVKPIQCKKQSPNDANGQFLQPKPPPPAVVAGRLAALVGPPEGSVGSSVCSQSLFCRLRREFANPLHSPVSTAHRPPPWSWVRLAPLSLVANQSRGTWKIGIFCNRFRISRQMELIKKRLMNTFGLPTDKILECMGFLDVTD